MESENVEVIEEVGEGSAIHRITKTIKTQYIEQVDDSSHQVRKSSTGSSSSDDDIKHLQCSCVTPSGKHSTPLISDNHDGTYTVDINADEPGIHTIEVELDGNKIPGSPYMVRIVQAADKRKVHFYGKGIQSCLLDHFEGLFYVDTKGAGPGELKVRIKGPKDGFNVMLRKNPTSDRVVDVEYEPTVEGEYTINVFWSGEHAEGSPKKILLTNNEEELRQWRKENERRDSQSSNGSASK